MARDFGGHLQANLDNISNVSKANGGIRFLLTAVNVISPAEVSANNQEYILLKEWNHDALKHGARQKKELSVGGYIVRVTVRRMAFSQSYRRKWTGEVFTIGTNDT